MAEPARIDRLLAVTREHFVAPPGARERLRAELLRGAAQGAGDDRSSGVRRASPRAAGGVAAGGVAAGGIARSMAALLATATFVAGFLLRAVVSQSEPAQAVAVPVAATQAAPLPSPAHAVAEGSPSAMRGTPDSAPNTLHDAASGQPAESAAAELGGASAGDAVTPEPRRTAARAARPTGASRATRAARRPSRPQTSQEELTLLRRAEHAIRSGEPDLALSFLDDLDRRHAETRFAEERAAARLMARCARGDAEAITGAARFLRSRPSSVYSERVRALCSLDKDGEPIDGSSGAGH